MNAASMDRKGRLASAHGVLDFLKSSIGGIENLEQVFGAIDAPCLITDGRRGAHAPTILFANDAFEKLCGYTPADIRGHSPKVLQGDDTDVKAARRFREELEQNGHAITDLINYRKDGTPYEVLLLGARLKPRHALRFDPDDSCFISIAFKLSDAPLWPSRAPTVHL